MENIPKDLLLSSIEWIGLRAFLQLRLCSKLFQNLCKMLSICKKPFLSICLKEAQKELPKELIPILHEMGASVGGSWLLGSLLQDKHWKPNHMDIYIPIPLEKKLRLHPWLYSESKEECIFPFRPLKTTDGTEIRFLVAGGKPPLDWVKSIPLAFCRSILSFTKENQVSLNMFDTDALRLRATDYKVPVSPTLFIGENPYSLWDILHRYSDLFEGDIQWTSTHGGIIGFGPEWGSDQILKYTKRGFRFFPLDCSEKDKKRDVDKDEIVPVMSLLDFCQGHLFQLDKELIFLPSHKERVEYAISKIHENRLSIKPLKSMSFFNEESLFIQE